MKGSESARLAVVFLCERGFKEGVKNNNDLGYNLGGVFARHNSAFKGFLFGHRHNAEFGSLIKIPDDTLGVH